MSCDEYRNILHEYASGSLSELEHHAAAKHIKSCSRCRREVEEITKLKAILKSGSQDVIIPPADLKSEIMASINPKKYKKVHKNTMGELANWGMSLVAAGLILLLINAAPADDLTRAQNVWENRAENISEKIQQPLASISESLDRFTKSITELDGITWRIEKVKKGGN